MSEHRKKAPRHNADSTRTSSQLDESPWMRVPKRPDNCPPGLEYLSIIDQLLVSQKRTVTEEPEPKWVKNRDGQKIYYAVEKSPWVWRNCCEVMRPIEWKILDYSNKEIICMNRPKVWCRHHLMVYALPDTHVGTVREEMGIRPVYGIMNANRERVLKIRGPCCVHRIFRGAPAFKILLADGTQIGKISKLSPGLLKEQISDADYFGITFPMDLDVGMKAVMLGACLLINVMYYERIQQIVEDGFDII